MDDDEDAPMIESDNEIDSDALEAGGYSARGPQADDRASLPSKLETVEQMEVDSSLPGCSSQRTADEQHNSSSFEAAAKADGPGYAGSARSWQETSKASAEAVTAGALQDRARRMFAGGPDASIQSGGDPVAKTVTVGLISAVKKAIEHLYKHHRNQVCRSPERCDLQLSQEEALGYLIGDLIFGELLAVEARSIGKRLDYHAGTEKKADNDAMKQAKTRNNLIQGLLIRLLSCRMFGLRHDFSKR